MNEFENINACPLAWPDGWPRGDKQVPSRFGKWNKPVSIAKATNEVLEQLRMMGVKQSDTIISSNLKLRLDGLPRSGQLEPVDSGASVWFARKGGQKVIAIDQYNKVADNLWAIAKTLEAMRGIDRWGGGQILERAFSGFIALPSPSSIEKTPLERWKSVLGVDLSMSDKDITPEYLKRQYKRAVSKHHPDKGGSRHMLHVVNDIYKHAKDVLWG